MIAPEALASRPQADTQEFRFRAKATLPPLRNDLKIVPVSFRGRDAWVVKDPLSLRYFRWGSKEYALSTLLNGELALESIVARMQRLFPDEELEPIDIEQMLNTFLSAGLLRTDGSLAQRLHAAHDERQAESRRRLRWIAFFSKLISFKINLFDPDILLLHWSRRLAFFWSWPAVTLLIIMLGISGWLLLRDTGSLGARTPDIFGWQNLVIIWVVMIIVKIVHEFGHGLSCKYFGGEVHEMGAMFILFSPFLYCNASDSWTFPDKWKRLVVNFGGIYLELFLAAVAAALWVTTEPGFFNQICFNVMLVCSVMTIFFNVNPLMKFDGYYALSDFLEVPNLKERGDKALVSHVAGAFTGEAGMLRDPVVERFKIPILAYAIASYVWTFVVAYNILRGIGHMLEPMGLDRLMQAGSGIVLLVGVLAPPLVIARQVWMVLKGEDSQTARARALRVGALLVLVLAGLLAFPVPVEVRTTGILEPQQAIRITAATPGFLRKVLVKDGETVQPGQLLAQLENPRLAAGFDLMKLDAEIAKVRESLALIHRVETSIPALRVLSAQYHLALQKYESDIQNLEIVAPAAGVVSGLNLDEKVGTLISSGQLFCLLLVGERPDVQVVLNEKQVGLVKNGQKVYFKSLGFPKQAFAGIVEEVSPVAARSFPHQALSAFGGGSSPSVMAPRPTDPSGGTVAMPTDRIYKAKIRLDETAEWLRPGLTGRVKIKCGTAPLGFSLFRQLRDMIRTDFQI